MQRFVSMLSYEDVGAAAEWLTRAFGLAEVGERFADESGRVTHAEVGVGGERVMLGWPGPHFRAPRRHAEECAAARKWLDTPFVVDGVLVQVEDLDAHLARARAAGAGVLRGPDDLPIGRLYTAEDPEGHRWMFLQPKG